MRIYCLSLSGAPLTMSMNEALYLAAREMLREKIRRKRIATPEFCGLISTAWESYSMGSISGVAFSADVVSAKVQTSVEYIVRASDLDDPDTPAPWHTVIQDPQLEPSHN